MTNLKYGLGKYESLDMNTIIIVIIIMFTCIINMFIGYSVGYTEAIKTINQESSDIYYEEESDGF